MNFKRKISKALMITSLFSMNLSAATIEDVPGEVAINQMKNPKIVELYSPVCSHCRQMAPVYTKVAQKCNGDIHFYKVNVTTTEGLTVANKVAPNVSGVPTFVFVDKNGKPRGTKSGGMSESDLITKIDQLLQ